MKRAISSTLNTDERLDMKASVRCTLWTAGNDLSTNIIGALHLGEANRIREIRLNPCNLYTYETHSRN